MPTYEVTYTDPEGIYPAPKQTQTIEAEQSKIWTEALKLGFVRKIFNLDTVQTVYSINWDDDFNAAMLGVTQTEIRKNLEF